MPDYSRKKYNQIKNGSSTCTDILLLPSDDLRSVFWTYDADAVALAKLLHRRYSVSKKGPVIAVTTDDLAGYPFKEVSSDQSACLLRPYLSSHGERSDPWDAGNDNLPQSALLRAKVIHGNNIESITVVSDAADQDSGSNIYWENRTLSKKLIRAISMGSRYFLHIDESYNILQIFYTEAYFEKIEKKSHFLDIGSDPKTLYVTSQAHFGESFKYEPVSALFFYAGSSEPAEMQVYYSVVDEEYYTDKATFEGFRKQYGLPYARLENKSKIPSELEEESELHLYGYTVRQNTLSEKARQAVLARLVDCGIMTKEKIHNHLSFLISLSENNSIMNKAREKWQADLLFIDSYKQAEQKPIWAAGFVTKGPTPSFKA